MFGRLRTLSEPPQGHIPEGYREPFREPDPIPPDPRRARITPIRNADNGSENSHASTEALYIPATRQPSRGDRTRTPSIRSVRTDAPANAGNDTPAPVFTSPVNSQTSIQRKLEALVEIARGSRRQFEWLERESRKQMDWLESESRKQFDRIENELAVITEELGEQNSNGPALIASGPTPQHEAITVVTDSRINFNTPVNTGEEHRPSTVDSTREAEDRTAILERVSLDREISTHVEGMITDRASTLGRRLPGESLDDFHTRLSNTAFDWIAQARQARQRQASLSPPREEEENSNETNVSPRTRLRQFEPTIRQTSHWSNKGPRPLLLNTNAPITGINDHPLTGRQEEKPHVNPRAQHTEQQGITASLRPTTPNADRRTSMMPPPAQRPRNSLAPPQMNAAYQTRPNYSATRHNGPIGSSIRPQPAATSTTAPTIARQTVPVTNTIPLMVSAPLNNQQQRQQLNNAANPSVDPTDERILSMIKHAEETAQNEPVLSLNVSKMGIKVDIPSYDGNRTLAAFEDFIKDTLRYFLIYQLMPPELERQRIRILGTTLKSDANRWFKQTIDTQDQLSNQWAFADVVLALKHRFVHRAASQDAAKDYDKLRQGNKTVMEFYNELRALSQHMVEIPTAYDFRRHFMDGLIPGIRHRAMEFGVSAETTSIEDTLDQALQIEASRNYVPRDGPSTIKPSTRTHPDGKTPVNTHGKPVTYTGRFTKRPANRTTLSSKSAVVKPTASYQPAAKSGQNGGNKPPQQNSSSGKPKLIDRTAVRCYTCNNLGHMSNNCPYSAKAAAGNIVDGNDGNDEMDAPIGDQYESGEDLEEDYEPVVELEPDEYELVDTTDGVEETADADTREDEYDERAHAGTLVPWLSDAEIERHAGAATTQESILPILYRHRASRKALPGEQPTRRFNAPQTLHGYIEICGIKAHVLFDSGCTTDMVSPDFLAGINQIPFELDTPVGLQLATIGSKSKINFGFHAKLKLSKFECSHYVDVANLDQYDLILGTPFLRKFNAVIDFANPASITLRGERHVENSGEFGAPLKRGRIAETKPTNVGEKSTTMTVVERKTVKPK